MYNQMAQTQLKVSCMQNRINWNNSWLLENYFPKWSKDIDGFFSHLQKASVYLEAEVYLQAVLNGRLRTCSLDFCSLSWLCKEWILRSSEKNVPEKLSHLAQNSTLINHLCEANKIFTNGMFVQSAWNYCYFRRSCSIVKEELELFHSFVY